VKRKRYPRKFQRMAVERMRTCEDVGELAKELGVTGDVSTSGEPNSIWWKRRRSWPGRTPAKRAIASKFSS
jgi:hypothetical protein